jgi:hypothetical protein
LDLKKLMIKYFNLKFYFILIWERKDKMIKKKKVIS